MSEQDDTDEKITVLFPDKDSGDADAKREDDQPDQDEELTGVETSGESSPGEKEQKSGDADRSEPEEQQESSTSSEGDANVVRLDFESQSSEASSETGTEADSDPGSGSVRASEGTKDEVFERMIAEGMVMVTLDTRVEGVQVPPKFRGLPELRLNFSHMFHIDDFDYDEDGVCASLSFDGARHFCNVPWEAVFMLYSHESGDVIVFDPVAPE